MPEDNLQESLRELVDNEMQGGTSREFIIARLEDTLKALRGEESHPDSE